MTSRSTASSVAPARSGTSARTRATIWPSDMGVLTSQRFRSQRSRTDSGAAPVNFPKKSFTSASRSRMTSSGGSPALT